MDFIEWLPQLIQAAKDAGPYALALGLGALWWLERGERIAAQKQILRTVEALEGNNRVNTALAAAMENRTRATDAMAAVLKEVSLRLEYLERSVDGSNR